MSSHHAFAEALIEAGADGGFRHEAVIYNHVPRWVVEAYAQARLAGRPGEDIRKACLAAHFGPIEAASFEAFPKCVGLQIGRAWCARLGQLERRARGLPAANANVEDHPREAVNG